MSDYEVHMPDGRSVSVSASTPEEAAAAARNFAAREKGTESGKAGGVDNFGRSLARGASFGFADEFAAAMDAAVGPGVDKFLGAVGLGKTNTSTHPDWSGRYAENLARERGQDAGYDEAHPAWSTAGKIAGGIGGAVATLPRAVLSGGATAIGNVAKGAGVGAGLGGVTGFGEGEGGLDSRLDSALAGAETGGAAGAILAPVAPMAGNVGRYIGETRLGQAAGDIKARIADALGASAPIRSTGAAGAGERVGGRNIIQKAADAIGGSGEMSGLDRGAYERIADALQRGGGTVEGARGRLGELGQGATLSDIDVPQVTRLARTAYISPGEAPRTINANLDARNAGTGPRMRGAINEATGDTAPIFQAERDMRGARSGEGGTNYAAANAEGLTVTPEMQQILKDSPKLRDAIGEMRKTIADAGESMPDVELLHKVKRKLNTEAEAKYGAGSPEAKTVGNLANKFEEQLFAGNPALESADLRFAQQSKAIDALDLGRSFMQQGISDTADAVSVAALESKIPLMSRSEARAFIVGAADTMNTVAKSGPDAARQLGKKLATNENVREKLVTMLGEQNANRIFARAETEATFAATNKTIRGGSDTASKALSVADDAASGGVPTSISGVIGSVVKKGVQAYQRGRAGNEDVRNRIAQILTDANQTNAPEHIRRIAEALAQAKGGARGVQRGAAAAAGGAGNQGL